MMVSNTSLPTGYATIMKMDQLLISRSCWMVLLLLTILGFCHPAKANCQPDTGSYAVTLPIGNIVVPPGLAVGGVISTTSVSNGGTVSPYWVYCASGQAQLLYEVSGTTVSSYSSDVFDTGVPGVGIRIKYSSNEISSFSLNTLGGWEQIYSMTFYYDRGKYVADLIKTNNTVGAGTLSKVHIRQSTDRGNTLGTLDFGTGSIIASGCTVKNSTLNIPLGDHKTTEFSGVGSTTTSVNVPITVNCQSAGTLVKTTITATALNASQGVIALDAGGGSGVGVQILGTNGTPAPIGATSATIGTSVAGDNTFDYSARYYQTDNSITPGVSNASATFTMSYQ